MPLISPSNNKIRPSNARNADVAAKAIQEIIPVQQERYFAAFVPQGFSAVLYNRLTSGRPCTCQSTKKQINSVLGKDGKAPDGVINQLITGDMSFDITPYNYGNEFGPDASSAPLNSPNVNAGAFDVSTLGDEFPFADVNTLAPDFGDNGPTNPVTVDDLLLDFDTGAIGWSDVACPVCFGTGFIGGFTTFNTYRKVLGCQDLVLINGYLDPQKKPWQAKEVAGFNQAIVLPIGAIGVDAFRVWNNLDIVAATFSIDNTVITNEPQLLSFCDGKPHLVTAAFKGDFTHLEIQFVQSEESVYFEFPKRPSNADTGLLEQMDPFQIIMSPNVPVLNSMDVIVESQLGKVLVVQNTNPWVTRQRNVLGPECQVRVIQPQEIFRILPTRGRIRNMDRATNQVIDNIDGAFRV